ncbi:MAG: hypothetical protein L0241_29805 [Planctomycetia bacterium]|nr:hypothetical protein [Planctomycetia bacterium]
MTPLVLSLALTAPAHPPAYRPAPPPPIVRVQPQIPARPVYRPVVVPTYQPPVYQPPVYQPPVYPVQPIQPIAPQAVTLAEFSRFFTPTPGKHHVWIIHPVTHQPVQVCFVLPGGKLTDFEVDRRSIWFEFRGGYEVEIEFRNNGTVCVEYDD